jgi:hypothetical protein
MHLGADVSLGSAGRARGGVAADAEAYAGDCKAAAALHMRAAESAAAFGEPEPARASSRREGQKPSGRPILGFKSDDEDNN